MSKATEKIFALYTLLMLRGKDPISLSDLARTLDCSKQSVLRYLDQLEASGYGKLEEPILRGREHLYRMVSITRPHLTLGAKELSQLTLCRKMLLHILPKEVSSMLGQGESPKADDPGGTAGGVGLMYSKGYIDYGPHQERYALLLQAVQQQRVCMLTYRRGLPDKCRTFPFAPMQLIVYRESISFLGWEVPEEGPVKPVYDNPVNLYLQRCLDVRLTRRSSSCLPPPPAAQHGPDASPFGTMKGEVFRVKVHFKPAASAYVYDRKWSSHQEMSIGADGSLTLEFDAQSTAEVVAWVLGFGSSARVLEPEWLKDRVLQELETAAQGYSQPSSDFSKNLK